MRIGVTGASGFIGRVFVARAASAGHEVVGYSRRPEAEVNGVAEMRLFDASSPGASDFSGLDALVHLAAESVLGFYTKKKKARIRESRVPVIEKIVESFATMENPPGAFFVASGVGFYGSRGDEVLDEGSERGTGFLADLAVDMEAAASSARESGVRVVALRIGFVLGRGGSAGSLLRRVFGCCLGGKLGTGKHWMPWVHVDDTAGMLLKCVEDGSIDGPVNLVAPNPVRNAEFTVAAARAARRPAIFAVPGFLIRLLAREMGELLLSSQRVMPVVMQEKEFEFAMPEIDKAMEDLFSER